MPASIVLPSADGTLAPFVVADPRPLPPVDPAAFNRVAYAAAHVVVDPLRTRHPLEAPAVDWDTTLAFRRHLWSLGFKVAEAMDTAQRGMGLSWPLAQELIRRSVADARTVPGADLACGAGTDHLPAAGPVGLDDVVRAYEEQVGYVESVGGRVIMMASRALARAARGPEDYVRVYSRILSQASGKVILHWLGTAFDPALSGYWGSDRFEEALPIVLSIISDHRSRIDGIKISLLDASYEEALRARLPEGVRMYTGDDFNYADLIAGDGTHRSHALLGIFDAVAPVAASALTRLGQGDEAGFRALIEPTVPLSRTIFEAPTQHYKAGVVFLAWLNGHQDHFHMLAGLQSARSVAHYAEVLRLASAANLIADPDLAVARMRVLLATAGLA